jgi:hypothetical protein
MAAKHEFPQDFGRDLVLSWKSVSPKSRLASSESVRERAQQDLDDLAPRILRRDRHRCFCCLAPDAALGGSDPESRRGLFHIHHIDGDFTNNAIRNLVTLCPLCHACLHLWNTCVGSPREPSPWFPGKENGVRFAFIPWIRQAELNLLQWVMAVGMERADAQMRVARLDMDDARLSRRERNEALASFKEAGGMQEAIRRLALFLAPHPGIPGSGDAEGCRFPDWFFEAGKGRDGKARASAARDRNDPVILAKAIIEACSSGETGDDRFHDGRGKALAGLRLWFSPEAGVMKEGGWVEGRGHIRMKYAEKFATHPKWSSMGKDWIGDWMRNLKIADARSDAIHQESSLRDEDRS